MIDLHINNDWKEILSSEFKQHYFKELIDYVTDEYSSKSVYPGIDMVFNAFRLTSFTDLKVVIIGQDPYHGPAQAHGLAFSVQDGISFPPSLRNIFQEYCSDLDYTMPISGDLCKWAEEGVLLLNTVLTVRDGEPNSHSKRGWETFTDSVISMISDKKEHVVFILWGKPAQSKISLIDQNKHCIIRSPHPSPLSAYRGFFGSKPFSRTNKYLLSEGIAPVNWKLD